MRQISSRESYLYASNKCIKDCIIAALNSSTYFWWYIQNSDTRTNNPSHLKKFPIDLDSIDMNELQKLSIKLLKDLQKNAVIKNKIQKTGLTEYAEYYPRLSKSIIDQIDILISKSYNLNQEELDFILNYDLRFRMGENDTE